MEEYRILKYIKENKNINQRNISNTLNISIGNVNSKIKDIEKEKLIVIEKYFNKLNYSFSEKGLEKWEIALRNKS